MPEPFIRNVGGGASVSTASAVFVRLWPMACLIARYVSDSSFIAGQVWGSLHERYGVLTDAVGFSQSPLGDTISYS